MEGDTKNFHQFFNNRIWSPSQLRRQAKVSEQSFLGWFLSFILLKIFFKKIQFVSSYGVQRASLVAQCLKIHLQCRRLEFNPWVRKICWRKKWQSMPVFFPGEPYGQWDLVDYTPQGCKVLDTTQVTEKTCTHKEYKHIKHICPWACFSNRTWKQIWLILQTYPVSVWSHVNSNLKWLTWKTYRKNSHDIQTYDIYRNRDLQPLQCVRRKSHKVLIKA